MKGRVLIVDDEPVVLGGLRAILVGENFEVEAVSSAAAAIAALDEGEFDLVITDMAMETETAGYDVVRAAQRQSYRPEVIIYTGLYIPATEWKQKGVKELFTKGEGTPANLINAITKIFNESNRGRAAFGVKQRIRQRLGA
jgi:CheY-like chemotaxis protein